jgi:hypothetical protein
MVSMAPEDIAPVRVPLATPGAAVLLAVAEDEPDELVEEQAVSAAIRAAASASGPRSRRDECAISFSDRFLCLHGQVS